MLCSNPTPYHNLAKRKVKRPVAMRVLGQGPSFGVVQGYVDLLQAKTLYRYGRSVCCV